MIFASRTDAGQRLGEYLVEQGVHPDLVLGLPRGGVAVAVEVARILGRPLDVLVARKIGHPRHREFAVGALAEHGVVLLNETAMAETRVEQSDLEEVIAEEIERARDYQAKFHPGGLELAGKSVLIVDDGLATGATAEAAVMSAKKQNARMAIVAAPVASRLAVSRLERVADAVMALEIDPDFMAVGQYYDDFPQMDDDEVAALLHAPS